MKENIEYTQFGYDILIAQLAKMDSWDSSTTGESGLREGGYAEGIVEPSKCHPKQF